LHYPAVDGHLLNSKDVHQTFRIDVMRPAQKRGETRRFPVVYAIDLCTALAQLTYPESLRYIEGACGLSRPSFVVSAFAARSCNTLADANATRDWRLYADFAQGLIATAHRLGFSLPALTIAELYPRTVGLSLTTSS